MQYAEVSSLKELPSLNGKADAFVCGSDVIWRPDYNKGIGAYYLDFANKYKFSYAASFGKASLDRESLVEPAKHISKLNQISVREESGKKIAEAISGKIVKVVGDPIILLTRQDWENVVTPPKKNSKYIFVYTTHANKTLNDFVQKLSEQTHLRVVRSIWVQSAKEVIKQRMTNILSPQQWLQQLRDAEYVITNSFHATVFSTIFHKKFFSFPPQCGIMNTEPRKELNPMKFTFTEKKMEPSQNLRDYTERKAGKLDRFFKNESEAFVTFSTERGRYQAELTIKNNGTFFRASELTSDMYASVDSAVATIERQIRKNKTRLAKKLREGAVEREVPALPIEVDEEPEEFEVVRRKQFSIKPMSVEEAILQMNLLEHEFFVFRDESENGAISVVYRRKKGGYGLISDADE